MKNIRDISNQVADIMDKYIGMPDDVKEIIEILLRELVKRENGNNN